MSESDRLAVAAHLHVALRRKTGRVTDTEWMAADRTYGKAMVAFALNHAHDNHDADLERLALRLAALLGDDAAAPPQPASKPLAQGITQTARRYVGGLR